MPVTRARKSDTGKLRFPPSFSEGQPPLEALKNSNPRLDQVMFVSATPADNMNMTTNSCVQNRSSVQPDFWILKVEVRPIEGQIDDLIGEVNKETCRTNIKF